MSEAPEISVVIASFCGEEPTRRILEAIAAQAATADDVEVLVATSLAADPVARLGSAFPRVRFLTWPGRATTVFTLRSLGVSQARGRRVALLEDHAVPEAGWLAAFRNAEAPAGGPVACGVPETGYGFALYLCEYGALMPPVGSQEKVPLSAVNACYGRDDLLACRDVWEHGFFDNEVNDAFAARGRPLRLVPAACVRSHLALSFTEATRHLFAGGRRFGWYRTLGRPLLSRGGWLLISPAVAPLMLARILTRLARRRPDRLLAALLALPWLVALASAWALGESAGYLAPVVVKRQRC